MKYKLIAILSLFIFSCSPEHRLASLLKNHPELIKKDTVVKVDTVIIAGHRLDTVFYYKQTDTVIKKEGGVTIKYFYNIKDSTVYLQGKRDTIVVIKEVKVPFDNVTVLNDSRTWIQKVWGSIKGYLIFSLFGVILVLFLIFKNNFKIK